MHKSLLGAHLSIAGGIQKSIEQAEEVGATAIQIFTKNSRSWFAKDLTSEEIKKFTEAQKHSSVKIVVAHASYLINIASPNEKTEELSRNALLRELERCNSLKIPYLILHPGSHTTCTEEEGMARIVKNINIILEAFSGNTSILLETMAGQGTNIGHRFEQIKQIISSVKSRERIGVCFDTCHIFSAGYNFGSANQYHKTINEFDKVVGLKNLKIIHLNDSKTEQGSRKDRHEEIGKGTIPLGVFKEIMRDEKLKNIPKILETPATNGISDYKKEIELLRTFE
jgi:deoxyribonuclease IV